MPLTVAKVVERRPKPVDRDGFALRYVAELSEHGAFGAEVVLDGLDAALGTRTKARGVYQATYEEVREAYAGILADAPTPAPVHPWYLRYAALFGISVCVLWMAGVGSWAIIGWMIVCMFKKQSGLLTMGETAVVWSIFDTRPLITRLWRYYRAQ